MRIGGLQKLTLLDYPGKTACIVFLQGCNFRCPYCHNSGLVLIDPEEETVSEEDFFKYLKKRQGILDGVVVTGGEPLLHKEIVPFLQKIKELGYSVKLDTNGTNPTLLKEICGKGLIDYVAMDIKHTVDKYEQAIGVCNIDMNKVKESASYLMEENHEYEFRTTLVKGIHTYEDMEQIAEWIGGSTKYYLQNFRDSGSLIGSNNQNISMDSFTEEELTEFKRIAQKKLDVIIRNI